MGMANPYVVAGGTIVGLGLVTGLAVWARKAHAATPGTPVTPDNLINAIMFVQKQAAMGNEELAAATRKRAADMAKNLGLAKTAAALNKKGAPLPLDENWPGTNMSVAAYVMEQLSQAQKAAA